MSIAIALLLMLQPVPPRPLDVPLPISMPCPVAHAAPAPRETQICFGTSGSNFAFAYAYPVEAAAVAELDRQLREARDAVWLGFQEHIEFARANPQDRYAYEEVYSLDASTPQFLALSAEVWEQAGGDPRRTGESAILWDHEGHRGITLGMLFTDPDAAFREMERLACPALASIRAGFRDRECVRPAHDARPIAGPADTITGWRVLFGDLDESGGVYEIRIPVTAETQALIQPRYRLSFAVSGAPPRACGPAPPELRCPPLDARNPSVEARR